MLHGLRRRASGHRHLLTGSAALVLTAGVQALSGALFWLIAARVDDQTDVGHATALFTSVLFVAFVAGLGGNGSGCVANTPATGSLAR